MKKYILSGSALVVLALAAGILVPKPAHTAVCTPTTYMKDGFNLTAFIVDPSRVVSGDVDATGCDVGVYYTSATPKGLVRNAHIHGARYMGVLNNGTEVNVNYSTVYTIGNTPFDGDQHGVGIYYDGTTSPATGGVYDTYVYDYQKNGLVATGPHANMTVKTSTFNGRGPIDSIAQNGIEAANGAVITWANNVVTGHNYTGANFASSTGYLVVGGACFSETNYTVGAQIINNFGRANDIGIAVLNLDTNCNAAATLTKAAINNNTLENYVINNTTGNGAANSPYQTGISDEGNGDTAYHNTICGVGYAGPAKSNTGFVEYIDGRGSINFKSTKNVTCANRPITTTTAAIAQVAGKAGVPAVVVNGKKRYVVSP